MNHHFSSYIRDPRKKFTDFLSILSGNLIEISISNVFLLNVISDALQIQSLKEATENWINAQQISFENIFDFVEYQSEVQSLSEPVKQFLLTNWDILSYSEEISNLSIDALTNFAKYFYIHSFIKHQYFPIDFLIIFIFLFLSNLICHFLCNLICSFLSSIFGIIAYFNSHKI